MWTTRDRETDLMQDHRPTHRVRGQRRDAPRTRLLDRHEYTRAGETEWTWDEVAARSRHHPSALQTAKKNALPPHRAIGRDAGTGYLPMRGPVRRNSGQPGGMHVVRYSFFGAVIAALWYGIRVGRAWWEMP